MQWVILIGNESLTLDTIRSVEHFGSLQSYDIPEIGERYCVDYGEDHIFYDYEDSVRDDYKQDELDQLPFQNPHFIMMVYQSKERMRKILRQDNFPRDIYVDDTFNQPIPIEEFIKN